MPQGLMTPALEVTDERQKTFITNLQQRIGCGAELLQTSVEDLKTRIIEKLNPPAKAAAAPSKQNGREKLKQVYLICENRDRSLVRPIKEYLFKQNIEVITWFDGDSAATLMDYHHKNLRECDAALVYFGNGDEPWVRKNLEDLEKSIRLRPRGRLERERSLRRRAAERSERRLPYAPRALRDSQLRVVQSRRPARFRHRRAFLGRRATIMGSRPIKNPFPGLRPFETDEYRLFFGREGQADELISRLSRARFLAVVGTSGSGKSSLIRAGLMPALRGGMMKGAGSVGALQ
jgi:hypothetical protein